MTRRGMLRMLAQFGGTLLTGLPILNDPAATNWQLNPQATPVPTLFPLVDPVPLIPNTARHPARNGHPGSFALGSDRFITEDWQALEGRRIGVVTNQTGIMSNGQTLISAIRNNPKIQLKALFAPEHGLHGTHGAGATFHNGLDQQTQVPVYSLYGPTKKPSAAMLADVDVLLFDIQDVGARTYTYISTLALVMQAAAEHRKSVWILDRPNPIGGTTIEGPVLEHQYSSFIGLYPLAMRHALTIGEIAAFYQHYFGLRCDLQVIRMKGYTRTMYWPDTQLPWTPTSPNMPHFRTAMVYLTTGPLGATGLVNGIGSGRPFELVLAPGLDGISLAAMLNDRHLPGVHFSSAFWIPEQGYWRDQRLDGIKITVTHHADYLAVHTGLEILAAISRISPEQLQYSTQFDRDWGTASLRKGLRARKSLAELAHQWQPRLAEFTQRRKAILLYS